MRTATACRQCRISKCKCVAVSIDGDALISCVACQQQNLTCSKTRAPKATPFLMPSLPVSTCTTQNTGELESLSSSTIIEFVELYIRFVHDRPHSLFHERSLWNDVKADTIPNCLLMAICAMGCRFSSVSNRHELSHMLRKKSSILFAQRLEDISLASISTCILLANLYAAEQNNQLEAMYFGIANRMAQILQYDKTRYEDAPITREIKCRVWWSLFMADKWCPSGLGLSPAIASTVQYSELPMDEVMFQAIDVAFTQPSVRSEGLWKYKITLVHILDLIQLLNRSLADDPPPKQTTELRVAQLSQQLQAWQESLPRRMLLNDRNLDEYRAHGYGGTFVALHLGYHHYSTLLHFPYLDRAADATISGSSSHVAQCRFHALSFSRLLRRARETGDCSVVYLTVAHMTTVSSSVLLHMLLYGADEEVEVARDYLVSNFETLIELKQYWPHMDQITRRLLTFQKMCLQSSGANVYKVDGWMVRFLLEHALPLSDKTEESDSIRISISSAVQQRQEVLADRVNMLNRAFADLCE